jgi:hypothetical protein
VVVKEWQGNIANLKGHMLRWHQDDLRADVSVFSDLFIRKLKFI